MIKGDGKSAMTGGGLEYDKYAMGYGEKPCNVGIYWKEDEKIGGMTRMCIYTEDQAISFPIMNHVKNVLKEIVDRIEPWEASS